MTAREYLDSIADAGKTIRGLKAKIEKMRESLTSISVPMDKEQVTHTKNVSAMSDQISRIVDLEREMQQEAERLSQMRLEALYYINQLDEIHSSILTMRYFERKSIKQIMEETHFSKSTTFEHLHNAMNCFQNILDKKSGL